MHFYAVANIVRVVEYTVIKSCITRKCFAKNYSKIFGGTLEHIRVGKRNKVEHKN
jgi:hypothetical protein